MIDEGDRALRRLDGSAALDAYARAIADGNDPDHRASAGRVRALWLLRRWDEARELLATLPRNSVYVELARGVVALGQWDWPAWINAYSSSSYRDDELALSAFGAAMRLDPKNAEAVAGYAAALRMSGKTAQARQLLAEADPWLRTSEPVLVELAVSASEREDDETARDHARRALEDDPDSLRATLALLIAERQLDSDSAAGVDRMAQAVQRYAEPPAALADLYAWALYEHARLLGEPDRGLLHVRAREQADYAAATGPGLPTAVSRAVFGEYEFGDQAAARELADRAIAAEPDSPAIRSAFAYQTWAGDDPEARMNAYRRVLDLDPRNLFARLNICYELIGLGRSDEARSTLTRLRAELPGNRDVATAWSKLDSPWQMQSYGVPTRVAEPWRDGRDDPSAVLELLTGEVIENLHLTRDAAGRLRQRVAVTRAAVLRGAFEQEQLYLRTREELLRPRPVWRAALGRTVEVGRRLLFAAGIAAAGWLVWLAGELVGLPDPWRLTGWAAVVLAVVAANRRFLFGRVEPSGLNAWAFAGLLASATWQGVLWFGTLAGIGFGLGVMAAAVGMMWATESLRFRFGPPDSSAAQGTFDVWAESLYGNGLLPVAVEMSSPGNNYSVWLPARSRIVSDAAVEIDTEASRYLEQLLDQRSKGSFALAGPRGAGKSTLLERWCAGEFLRTSDDRQTARRDLSVKVDAPVGYESRDFLVHLFGRVCDAVERWPAPSATDLVRRAREERERLRYLQTWTTEREGSLGLPLGATIGLRGKVSVQRDVVPLNHPELVDRFRDFLRVAAEAVGRVGGKVLIGIDELDRITDGDLAQRFLNELKAVFNVPNCYFLVSVSEDALADFELSAMGMRTAFDSAFDRIVRVDYLRFDEAKVLLGRRILDLPEQFAALAYVLSGGLARELARTAEEMGVHRTAEKRELGAVTAYLVQRQLSRTTRAAMDRLGRLAERRAGARLIPVLDEHPSDNLTGERLRDYARRVGSVGEGDVVTAVRLDVVVMVEYLAVLLEVFDNRLNEERMRTGRVGGLGEFETLARARRYLGANPYGARELLRAFCEVWKLPVSARAPGDT